MAKFVSFWHVNPNAPWPTDPAETAKLNEMLFAALDNLIKTGDYVDVGFFQDGQSGFLISTGATEDSFRRAYSFTPWINSDVREVVPYETAKEIMRAVKKAQAEAMKR